MEEVSEVTYGLLRAQRKSVRSKSEAFGKGGYSFNSGSNSDILVDLILLRSASKGFKTN